MSKDGRSNNVHRQNCFVNFATVLLKGERGLFSKSCSFHKPTSTWTQSQYQLNGKKEDFIKHLVCNIQPTFQNHLQHTPIPRFNTSIYSLLIDNISPCNCKVGTIETRSKVPQISLHDNIEVIIQKITCSMTAKSQIYFIKKDLTGN